MKNVVGKSITVSVCFISVLIFSISRFSIASEDSRISLEAVNEIALKKVSGTILETELDNEGGVLAYEVTVEKADGSVFEVKINAHTGSVISVEKD